LKISKETRWSILRGDWSFQISKFSSFDKAVFIFFTRFTVYSLNNSFFTYEIVESFNKITLVVIQRELVFLNLKILSFR